MNTPMTTDRAVHLLRGAEWITSGETTVPAAGQRPAYVFRRTIELPDRAASATLTITAHGIYEAFINGRRVGDHELTPGLTSYDKTLHVQTFPVAELLTIGSNEIRLVLSDGWFRGRTGASRIPDHYGPHTAVIASLDIDAGDRVRVVTDRRWTVGVGEIVAADLMDGQSNDLRRIGGIEWRPASVSTDRLTADTSRLVLSEAPPVRRTQKYPPVSIVRLDSGRQIVDFGTYINGWVRLDALGTEDTRTVLTHGEWLSADGDLDTTHAAYVRWPEGGLMTLGQVDSVISRGVDGDAFEPRHTTHGFRYVAVDGGVPLEPRDITAIMVRSDLRPTATFTSSDDRLNDLHSIAVQSWRVNSCDVPTDCPQRERWGYTGDYQIFAHTAAFIDDVEAFSSKWLRSLADEQHESGLITNVAPMTGIDPIIPHSLDGAAGWGDAATVVPWEVYRAYGDPAVLEQSIDMMVAWVDYVAMRALTERHPSRVERSTQPAAHERYIWDTGWQWGEWFEPDHEFDPEADQGIVGTAYLRHSARIVADALRVLARLDEAAVYADLSERAADAWRIEFVDAKAGRLTIDRQAHYVRALAFDLVDAADRPRFAERLVELVAEAGGHLTTGFLSTGLLLPTLALNGGLETAYGLLRQTSEPSWLTMLDRGATTVWESWDGVDADGVAHASLAHYSKGAVIDFVHEHVVGLRQHPDSAGWERFTVAPTPDDAVEWAGVEFLSRRGVIEARWERTPDGLTITVVVPPASTATICTPGGRHVVVGAGTHVVADSPVETPRVR